MALLKTYTISTDITEEGVDLTKLRNEITGDITNLAGIDKVGDSLHIHGDAFISEANVDAIVLAHDSVNLAEYKVVKNKTIDARTGELIAGGHTFATKVFSMSDNAQRNWQALDSVRTELTYPYTISTLDSLETYDIADAAEMHNFFLNALNTSATHQLGGQALRTSVNAATDKAGVDTVIDNR